MENLITVIGYGAVGQATTERLAAEGRAVRVVQRRRPADLPAGVGFVAADVLDAAALMAATAGSTQIVLAVGFAYDGAVWRDCWPKAMANVLAAAEAAHARIVFVDNLYMYGPQTEPLREDMPLTDYGAKPAVRAEITRAWQAAHRAGRVRFAALRAPDFYGPGVGAVSQLGDMGLGAIARGTSATFVVPLDQPHDFAYVPDIARAVITLLDADDDAYGEAWHVPSAPTRTVREIMTIGADHLGVKLKATAIPMWLLPIMGLFMPILKGFIEMRFQWDQPYRVDAGKFARRFWADATPFEVGVPATVRSFQPGQERRAA